MTLFGQENIHLSGPFESEEIGVLKEIRGMRCLENIDTDIDDRAEFPAKTREILRSFAARQFARTLSVVVQGVLRSGQIVSSEFAHVAIAVGSIGDRGHVRGDDVLGLPVHSRDPLGSEQELLRGRDEMRKGTVIRVTLRPSPGRSACRKKVG